MMKYEFLRQVPLFETMLEDDLRRLCDSIDEFNLPASEILFREGDAGDRVYIIQSGELEILKQAGQHEVRLAVRKTGDVIGEMSLLETYPRSATVRAIMDCHLLALQQEELDTLLTNSPTAARALLQTVTARLRATNSLLQERQKLAHLGTLSAGVAHELNNPAAAIARSADHLAGALDRVNSAMLALGKAGLNPSQWESLTVLARSAEQGAKDRVGIDPLQRMDREAELEQRLQGLEIEDAAGLAASLSETALSDESIDAAAARFPANELENLLIWLAALGESYNLLAEMKHGANSISEIVKALKSYVYLDRGPVEPVDLREGLEDTLMMMRHKLRQGIRVQREYDPTLPRVQAYGGELNQVWTNLIDNAVDAMQGSGILTIRTSHADGNAVVEIEDDGPGIPEDVRSNLFTPFFTTKGQGKGTGLGLSVTYNIVQKHNGTIDVRSRPGSTCFIVRLPVTQPAA